MVGIGRERERGEYDRNRWCMEEGLGRRIECGGVM